MTQRVSTFLVITLLALSLFLTGCPLGTTPAAAGTPNAFQEFLQLTWLQKIGLLDAPVDAPMGFVILLMLLILGVAAYGLSFKVGIPQGYCFMIAFFVVALSAVLMPRTIIFVAGAEYVTLFSFILIALPLVLLGIAYWFLDEMPWARFFIILLIIVLWLQSRSIFNGAASVGSSTGLTGPAYTTIKDTLFSGWIVTVMVFVALGSFLAALGSHSKPGVNADAGSIMDRLKKAKEGFGNAMRGPREAGAAGGHGGAAAGHGVAGEAGHAALVVENKKLEKRVRAARDDAQRAEVRLVKEQILENDEVVYIQQLQHAWGAVKEGLQKGIATLNQEYSKATAGTNLQVWDPKELEDPFSQLESTLGQALDRLDSLEQITRRQESTGFAFIEDAEGILTSKQSSDLKAKERLILVEHKKVKDNLNALHTEYEKHIRKEWDELLRLIKVLKGKTSADYARVADVQTKTQHVGGKLTYPNADNAAITLKLQFDGVIERLVKLWASFRTEDGERLIEKTETAEKEADKLVISLEADLKKFLEATA
ncbi:hypothetical protein HYV86_04910 [Candidatus Woesearchaeota archaeon]|nr:hypothetical protein [Candidatus Woesearchaeota archaeon]